MSNIESQQGGGKKSGLYVLFLDEKSKQIIQELKTLGNSSFGELVKRTQKSKSIVYDLLLQNKNQLIQPRHIRKYYTKGFFTRSKVYHPKQNKRLSLCSSKLFQSVTNPLTSEEKACNENLILDFVKDIFVQEKVYNEVKFWCYMDVERKYNASANRGIADNKINVTFTDVKEINTTGDAVKLGGDYASDTSNTSDSDEFMSGGMAGFGNKKKGELLLFMDEKIYQALKDSQPKKTYEELQKLIKSLITVIKAKSNDEKCYCYEVRLPSQDKSVKLTMKTILKPKFFASKESQDINISINENTIVENVKQYIMSQLKVTESKVAKLTINTNNEISLNLDYNPMAAPALAPVTETITPVAPDTSVKVGGLFWDPSYDSDF